MSEQRIYNEEIDFHEYVDIVRKKWKMIVFVTISFATLALLFSFLQKPVYEAETALLVRSSSGNSDFSQFANLAGLAGLRVGGKGDISTDLSGILESQAVAAKVLEDLKLKERIDGWDDPEKSDQKLIGFLQNMLDKPEGSGNIVKLRVEYTDPQLSAEIANGFVDALSYYWNNLNFTEAQNKKHYIEKQLPRVEKDLRKAEQKMKKFTLLSPSGKVASSNLLGLIARDQSQGIEIQRLSREIDIQDSVYTMLRKEYESVKLEESKEIPPFSVIDKATVPEMPIKPKKKLNTIIGIFLGFFVGSAMAFLSEYWEKSR